MVYRAFDTHLDRRVAVSNQQGTTPFVNARAFALSRWRASDGFGAFTFAGEGSE
jgi:hypothetical protein